MSLFNEKLDSESLEKTVNNIENNWNKMFLWTFLSYMKLFIKQDKWLELNEYEKNLLKEYNQHRLNEMKLFMWLFFFITIALIIIGYEFYLINTYK